MGPLLRRGSGSREPPSGRGSGVSTGEVASRLPSSGNTRAPRCHPVVGRFRRGVRFLGLGEPPGDAPLLPWEHLLPRAPSHCPGWLLAVPGMCGTCRVGSLGWGVESPISHSRGLAAALAHHGKLPAISETLVSGGGFFFLSRSRHPAFACAEEGGTEMTSRSG